MDRVLRSYIMLSSNSLTPMCKDKINHNKKWCIRRKFLENKIWILMKCRALCLISVTCKLPVRLGKATRSSKQITIFLYQITGKPPHRLCCLLRILPPQQAQGLSKRTLCLNRLIWVKMPTVLGMFFYPNLVTQIAGQKTEYRSLIGKIMHSKH